jgi:TetR/AcrR family transcriptional regulator
MRARGKETRRAILRAAEQVFAERGYAGARMDDVAAEVGIKRASMVYYFRDKRSLYLALLEDLFGELLQRYRTVMVSSGTARDRIFGFLDDWATHVAERPGSLRILMWESARIRRASAEPLAAELAPIQRTIIDVIESGQREGVFRRIAPLRFIMIVTGATAFLTLGMNVLAAEAEVLSAMELRTELRSLVQRILMAD